VHGQDHMTATRGSQCVAPAKPRYLGEETSRRAEVTPQTPERTRTLASVRKLFEPAHGTTGPAAPASRL